MEDCNQTTSLSGRSSNLEEELTVEQFSIIMDEFYHKGHQWTSSYQRISTEEFQITLANVLGRSPRDRKIISLSSKIDVAGLGFIDAQDFCSYILQKLKEKDSLFQTLSLPFNDSPKLRHTLFCKETICRLNLCTSPTRYISVSKNGLLGIWTSHLHYQCCTHLLEGMSGGSIKVTDCLVMDNCHKLVLSLSSRELAFYNMSTASFKCQFRLHDLSCVPLCLNYYFNPKAPRSKSLLLYGDDSGSVSILTFSDPVSSLFDCTSSKDDDEKSTCITYGRLSQHVRYVSLLCVTHLHADWVNTVCYLPHNHTFISSTNSSTNSLIVRDIDQGTNNYVFKIRKGVQCFDYCRSVDMLVTGSIDHFVRVWNLYVPAKPVASLVGLEAAVMGVAIAAKMHVIFGLARNLVVCAWDLYEHVLIQKVSIKLPFTQRLPDFGSCPLFLLPTEQSLVVICNEYIAELNLGLDVGDQTEGDLFTSHKHPLCSALFNKHFNQVVSGCEGGVVNIWDVDSGSLMVRMTECHGKNEITAMSLDHMGRLLMTGSSVGDIKVWQYIGSTCIKHMQKKDCTEVTRIVHIPEKRQFLSVGWDKKITAFKDDLDTYNAVPNESWRSDEPQHLDDILCMAYCPPYYLATGSFDGAIKVWNVDMERVLVQYQSICRIRPHLFKTSAAATSSTNSASPLSTASSSRPISRRLASRQHHFHSTRSSHIVHVPVDQILFLHTRMRSKVKGAGLMVTSEAGIANFWDLFGAKDPFGSFPMTEYEDENVLAMTTDLEESHLITGDTAGIISVFHIQHYCNPMAGEGGRLEAVARWKAHSEEVVSVDFVSHRTQPIVLSASGDGTVRLWTLMGHFIGTFGQEQPWDLACPATFQHPRTPWREMWKSNVNISSSLRSVSCLSSTSQLSMGRKRQLITPPIPESWEEEAPLGKTSRGSKVSTSKLTRSTSRLSPLVAPSQTTMTQGLGGACLEHTKKRRITQKERRNNLPMVESKAIADKIGLCIPFHALQLPGTKSSSTWYFTGNSSSMAYKVPNQYLKMEDISIPKDISVALNKLST